MHSLCALCYNSTPCSLFWLLLSVVVSDVGVAVQIVIKKSRNASEITESGTAKITEYASRGFRALGVAKGSAEGPIASVQWEAIGLLPLYDPPRHDTKDTIEKCIEKVGTPLLVLHCTLPILPILHDIPGLTSLYW